jgi:hypothetical protein
MTFGLDGSIWKKYPGGRSIVFDTIWGPYFLVPLAFAILVLVLEVGLVSRNRRIVQRVMNFAPLMLVLALPWTDGKVFREFFGVFVTTVGSPLWWTCWLLLRRNSASLPARSLRLSARARSTWIRSSSRDPGRC